MIFSDFTKAVAQLGDPKFRKVLLLGLGLTIALFLSVYALVLGLIIWITPDTFTLPWIGTVSWLDDLISGASLLLMIVFSVFLMVPVASAFTSLFLDGVADAVEEKHYPSLPPVEPLLWSRVFADTVRFLGILIGANLAALLLYALVPPAAPLIFWGLNGYLLGREYFQVVASRRLGQEKAFQLRRTNVLQIWLAGVLMAVPLSIPLINFLVPILGAATFTHLFHRVNRN